METKLIWTGLISSISLLHPEEPESHPTAPENYPEDHPTESKPTAPARSKPTARAKSKPTASAKSKPTAPATSEPTKNTKVSEKGKGRRKTATGGKKSSNILRIGKQTGMALVRLFVWCVYAGELHSVANEVECCNSRVPLMFNIKKYDCVNCAWSSCIGVW